MVPMGQMLVQKYLPRRPVSRAINIVKIIPYNVPLRAEPNIV